MSAVAETREYDVKDIPQLDIEKAKSMVLGKFEECKEDGIFVTNLRASLICPIGKLRMKKPCRSVNCDHLQCFDAATYLKAQESFVDLHKWLCPICEKFAQFKHLRVDSLFLQMLRKTPSWCTTVQFELDGSWSTVTKNLYNIAEIDALVKTIVIADSPVKTVDIASPEKNLDIDLTKDDSDVQILYEIGNVNSKLAAENEIRVLHIRTPIIDKIEFVDIIEDGDS